jgi:hypothetical protein
LPKTALFYILELRMNAAPTLLPQDVILVLKLISQSARDWTYARAGQQLGQSASQVYESANRAATAGLLYHPTLHASPNRAAVKEFLVHGVKYAFPVYRGAMTRGIPTSWAAPPLNHHIAASHEPPPVWPYSEGSVRGVELSPLYKTVPKAALADVKLYELLALVDSIREGRVRERNIAVKELTQKIDSE